MALVGSHTTIDASHDELFRRGIFTKSMLKTYLRCPTQFERRYVYGEKSPPGFASAMGVAMHSLMETWGRASMAKKVVLPEEARALVESQWKVQMEHVEDPQARDGKIKDQKLARMLVLWQEFKKKHEKFALGNFTATELAVGYDGSTTLGGVPVAGHIDAVWESGPGDYKFCTYSSPYRRTTRFSLEMVIYAALAKTKGSFLFPLIHNYVDPKKEGVEKIEVLVEEDNRRYVEYMIAAIVDQIKKGNFIPITIPVGTMLCTPKFCGYFGKTCPATRGIPITSAGIAEES